VTSVDVATRRARVVLVVDDEALCLLAVEALGAEGYVVLEAHDGAAALQMIRENEPDAIILDLGLPTLSGLDVLTGIRQFSDLPTLILSGRTDEGDRIQGLRLGADDFLVKPCSPHEVAVRLSAVLRRVRPAAATGVLDFDGLRIDVAAHDVTVDGKTVDLTPLEFELLACLARSPHVVVSRAQLLRSVWNSSAEWQATATVTEHVRRLRAKIEDAPQDPRWVITVRGMGYRFEPR
jgi:two-component system response regulator RegX3